MGEQIRVLYVDDEPALLEIARLFLEQTGEFRVDTVTAATEALATHAIPSYDAVISDYQMPYMDGIGFLKEVRKRFGDIPFILFTGKGREEVVIQAINEGADFYLQKGGDPTAQFAELRHKIRQAVRRKQAERSLFDSERRLADIIDFLPDATFAIDTDGTVIAWNRAIEEMTGIRAADMIGKGDYAYADLLYGTRRPVLIDLIDAPDEKIAELYTNVVRTGTSLTAETELPQPDGHRITVLAKVCHLYNQAGAITGTIESIRDITALRVATRELRKSEERFRNIIQNASDMIRILSREGIIRYTSPSTRRITGFDPGDLTGKDTFGYVHPDDRERVRGAFYDVIGKKNSGLPTEYRILHADGRYIDVEAIASNLLDVPGIEGIVSTIRPISERKKAEAELRAAYEQVAASRQELRGQNRELEERGQRLRESEESYRGLFNTIRQAIYILDSRGKFVDVNAGAEAMYGYARTDFIGKTPAFLSAPGKNNLPAVMGMITKALAGEPQKFEFWGLRKNGEAFPKDVWLYPGTYFGREVVVAIGSDITERKRAEDAERERHLLLDRTQEMAHIGSWTLDLPANRLHWSDEVYRIFGITPQEFAGSYEAFLARVHPEDRAEVDAAYTASVRNGADTYELVHRVVRRDTGEIRVVHEKCFHERDTGGTVVRSVGMVQDITGRVHAEEDLLQANRQLKLMTSITGHDINNKLAVILGYLALARTKSGDPVMNEFITKVESAAAEIQSQIEFTRIYQDLGTQELHWNDLPAILAGLNPPPSIRVVSTIPPYEIFADPMLPKVFYNLLDNSARHGVRTTKITISAHQADGTLTLVWEDNGVGVPDAEKEQIFARGVGKNTGLGLFLVREILSVTGITIRECGEPGRGARFELTVPQGEFRIRGG